MIDWEVKKLASVSQKTQYGFTASATSENTGVKFIRITDISEGNINWENVPYCSISPNDFLKYQLKPGDLVIARTGATVGYAKQIKADVPKAVFASYLVRFILKKEVCYEFIGKLIESNIYKNYIQTISGGAAQPNANAKDLSSFNFYSPKYQTQRKIAAILSAYDDLIEYNNKRIAILENMTEEIYKEWFVRMRFPCYRKTKFVRGIPEGWELQPIHHLCSEIRAGIRINKVKPNTRYIGLEHIPRKSITLKNYADIDSVNSDKLLFKERDILFGKIRPYLHKISIAHFSGACSSDTIVLRPKEPFYEAFLLFTVFSNTFVELATVASKGTKMPRADWDFLKNVEVLLPGKKLLIKYQDMFNNIYSSLTNLLNMNEYLHESKNLLLPRLLSGKLSVENLDIKFPPSMEREAEASI